MEEEKEKSKQKPGLNAVRPDDFTKERFKDMAKENDISQTEMFKRIFYKFLINEREEKQQQALNFEGEIYLISNDLNNILNTFKKIAEKAQNTIISTETNKEQTVKNLTLEVDTLSKKIAELEKRNAELEFSNNTFSEVKSSLEINVTELSKLLESTNKEKEHFKNDTVSKNKRITELEESYKKLENSYGSENRNLNSIVKNLKDEIETYHNKIKNLEFSNNSLEDTIKSIQNSKKSEIDALEGKYKLQVQDLEIKIKSLKENKDKEISTIRKNIETEMNAARIEEVANMKLDLARSKEKYTETLIELNSIKSLNNLNLKQKTE